MSDFITLLCLLTHIITSILIFKIWKWKSLAHPGFYFSFLWIISTLSQWILMDFNIAQLPYPRFINELNLLAAFASFCFCVFSFYGSNYNSQDIKVNFIRNQRTIFTYLLFLIALMVFNFLRSGATLSFAKNRYALVGDLKHISQSFSLLDSIISIFNSPLVFFTIAIGVLISQSIRSSKKISLKAILRFLYPLIITLIYSLIIGGRNPIIITIKNYFLGIGLMIPAILSIKTKIRIITLSAISIIFFSLFSTFIAEQRADLGYQNKQDYNSLVLEKFSGLMEYMSAHYWGYQLRRTDFANGDNLTYGVATFYGLVNISLPFSSVLGVETNLLNLLGISYDPLDVYKSGFDGFYTTSTIFSLQVRDFGLEGAYIATFLLVFLTQYIFINLFRYKIKTAFHLIPIILVFTYWASSNFNSGFTSLQPLLIGAVFFEITQRIKSIKS